MSRWSRHFLIGSMAVTLLIIAGCGGDTTNVPKTVSTASPAQAATASPASTQPLTLTNVVDARVLKDPQSNNKVIVGSIVGTGLRAGDTVLINNDSTFPTVFGNDTWLTFSMPRTHIKENSFTLQVVRPSTKEQSKPVTVTFKQ
jgi:phosphate/sulfate permease